MSPTIYRAPKPGFPKTAAETAAETAGETRGAWGTAAETAGGNALALRSRETALFPAGASFLGIEMSFLWYRGGLSLLFGIEISFLVSRFCILFQHLDRLLPGINPCVLFGPRHPVNWRSKRISIPKRRSKNLDTPKKTSRYQLKESPLPGSLRSSSPSTPPSTPSFPGSFRSSLRSSFGKSGLGGPVDGRGNGKSVAGTGPLKKVGWFC